MARKQKDPRDVAQQPGNRPQGIEAAPQATRRAGGNPRGHPPMEP